MYVLKIMASLGSMSRTASCLSRVSRTFLFRGSNRSGLYLSTQAPNGKPAEPSSQAAEQSAEAGEAEKAWQEEKNKLVEELKDVKDKYMRSLAETENVRQRMKKQVDDAKIFGIQGFCKDLLEVADILQVATESVPKEELKQNEHLRNLFEGLTMTESQLIKVFAKHGLEKISPVEGEKFDPNFHEALFQVPTPDKETNTIAIIQKLGYKLHNRTLRPALVGVFKGS